MLKDKEHAYTFDDFTLAPVYSDIKSRRLPDLSLKTNGFSMDVPIFSAPMNTITEHKMMKFMHQNGAGSVLHRYLTVEDQVMYFKDVLGDTNEDDNGIFVAVGATGDFLERAEALYSVGVRNFCIDVANGHSLHCKNATKELKSKFSDILVMAGNICTYDGAYILAEAGADLLRTGVGSGAVCSTRRVTGHGVPQLTALEDTLRIKDDFPDVVVISDGGHRCSGDIVKALAIGADAIMIGSMLAGTSATPGEPITDENNKLIKFYSGMASQDARKTWYSRSHTAFVPEGVSMKIAYKGETKDVFDRIVGGVRVGLSYAGANNIQELRENVRWIKVTAAGYVEGTPHGLNL